MFPLGARHVDSGARNLCAKVMIKDKKYELMLSEAKSQNCSSGCFSVVQHRQALTLRQQVVANVGYEMVVGGGCGIAVVGRRRLP